MAKSEISKLLVKFDIEKKAYGGVIKLLFFLRTNPNLLNTMLRGIGENKMTKMKLREIIKEVLNEEDFNNTIHHKPKDLTRIGWIIINQRKNDGRPLYKLYSSDDTKWGATHRMGSGKYTESSPLFYTVPIKVMGPNRFKILGENEKWSRPYAYKEIEMKPYK